MTDLFFEDWDPSFGSPYLIGDDQPDGTAVLAETADGLRIAPAPCDPRPTAFVDGVRRGEGLLYRQGDDGMMVRGTVGAYGCGAVLCEPEKRSVYGPVETKRLVIFGGGMPVSLPAVDGYEWEAAAIASTEPDAPLQELQTRMRMAEGSLAERLAGEGWLAPFSGKRRTTGMKKGMKESCIEDLASHGGPDHALATREGAAKRWIRGVRRPAIEPRNGYPGVPTRSETTEGNTVGSVFASRQRTPRGRRTRACA